MKFETATVERVLGAPCPRIKQPVLTPCKSTKTVPPKRGEGSQRVEVSTSPLMSDVAPLVYFHCLHAQCGTGTSPGGISSMYKKHYAVEQLVQAQR